MTMALYPSILTQTNLFSPAKPKPLSSTSKPLFLRTPCLILRLHSPTPSSSTFSAKPISQISLTTSLRASSPQKYVYPDPIPEFAEAEIRKFRAEVLRKLLKDKDTFGEELDAVVDVCAEVEKFDGMNNFNMWQCKVMDALIQKELDIALKDKTTEMLEKDWERINRQWRIGYHEFSFVQSSIIGGNGFGSTQLRERLNGYRVVGAQIGSLGYAERSCRAFNKLTRQIFGEFLHKEYGGPGTLLVEPFTNMLVALNEKRLPGAPLAARASLLWAQNYVDQDWEVWNSKLLIDSSS
uniref:Uncharacterized protein n=1 Tax=Quercus lobata TaxID=97700 RepID=A0A7N2L8X8_QUELO